jgi:hypothetical protein
MIDSAKYIKEKTAQLVELTITINYLSFIEKLKLVDYE